MAFQNRWMRQRPLRINDGDGGDMTGEHRECPTVRRPDDLGTPARIAHVKELADQTAIGPLKPDVELRTVENRDFLTDRDDLTVR
jgi:hypothetical protein